MVIRKENIKNSLTETDGNTFHDLYIFSKKCDKIFQIFFHQAEAKKKKRWAKNLDVIR